MTRFVPTGAVQYTGSPGLPNTSVPETVCAPGAEAVADIARGTTAAPAGEADTSGAAAKELCC
ncbi:hypothetical protein ACGFNX_26930 [Streptomyces sp. NPDC048723]|uniref:hypothetical protein n=1 Tax=unclassified Streptomyces TaxID=2593676 RepID=UPI000B2B818E